MTDRVPRFVVVMLVLLACIGCDQVSKRVAEDVLRHHGPVSLLGDTVRLHYVENAGGLLSFGAKLPGTARFWLFVVMVTGLLLLMLGFVLIDRQLTDGQVVALSFMIAGGFSNVADRLWLGSVRDFMNLGLGGVRTGVFNVADVAITVGAVVMIALQLRAMARRRRETSSAA